jgi:hypothetical protein
MVVDETTFGTAEHYLCKITFYKYFSLRILTPPWSNERVDKLNTCYNVNSSCGKGVKSVGTTS